MRNSLPILVLCVLPAFALASGDHAGGHEAAHDMNGMEGMSHAEHAGVAGRPGDAANVKSTIAISMDDTMRFSPERIIVKTGETVRFVIENKGKITHEMVIGTMDELKEHAAMMRAEPTMQHSDPGMIRLDPGKRGDIVWQFDAAGTVDFACLVPGHMEAGMLGKVVVE